MSGCCENSLPFTALTILAVLVGGVVEIIPTIIINKADNIEGVRQIPYTPLELAGRDIYVREGCYLCHSQMIRTLVRRCVAVRGLLEAGRKHLRSSVPMGIEAHRAGPGARRGQVPEPLAFQPHAEPARRDAGLDHAELPVALHGQDQRRDPPAQDRRHAASWVCLIRRPRGGDPDVCRVAGEGDRRRIQEGRRGSCAREREIVAVIAYPPEDSANPRK